MSSNFVIDEKECCYVVGLEVDEKIFILDVLDFIYILFLLRKF